jgi:hypothetical protein
MLKILFLAHAGYSKASNILIYLNNTTTTTTRTKLITREIDIAAKYASLEPYPALLITGASGKKIQEAFRFFSSPELKAQVSYSDRPLSVRLSVNLSVCPSVCQ